MKKIVIFAVAALVLIGGGFGGYTMFMKDDAEAKVEPEPEPEPVIENTVYIRMPHIHIPVFQDDMIAQRVAFAVSLEVPEAEETAVRRLLPKVTDAVLTGLYGRLSIGKDIEGAKVDVDAVRSMIAQSAGEVLVEQTIVDVLIQGVNQTPIMR